MSFSIVGEQIQKFRKESRLTQKELGEAIGVSSSAVSQWESGGTPDVSLLPAIADRLGVTINALFGRESVTQENMTEALTRYVASLPEPKRFDATCNLLWEIFKSNAFFGSSSFVDVDRLEQCEGHTSDMDDKILNRVSYVSDAGVILGVIAEDMSFMSVFPEPKKGGYDAFLASNEKYRSLFSTLSLPYALELIRLFYRRPPKHCTPGAIAKRLGVSVEETTALLTEFTEHRLLKKLEVEIDDGDVDVYIINDCGALVPFLYTARLMAESYGNFHLSHNKRTSPLLKSIAPDK